MEVTFENPSKINVDEIFYGYITQHKKEYELYLTESHFKLVVMTISIAHMSSLTYLIKKQ